MLRNYYPLGITIHSILLFLKKKRCKAVREGLQTAELNGGGGVKDAILSCMDKSRTGTCRAAP